MAKNSIRKKIENQQRPIEVSITLPLKNNGLTHKTLRNIFRIIKKIRPIKAPKDEIGNIKRLYKKYFVKKYYEQKVSIIIPIYYTDKDSIYEQLKSILSQKYSNYEVIVVNDNPKKSINLRDIFSDKEIRRITVVHHQSNKGRSAARNTGFFKSSGNILVYVDSGIILNDTHAIKKINGMYLLPTHKNTVCLFQVFQNIRIYGTDEYYSIAGINLEKMMPYEYLDNPLYFTSNFFACTRLQYSKYIFDEKYGTKWGVEDHDFALGQIITAGSKIIGNNNIYGNAKSESFVMHDFLKKRFERGLTFKYFYKKWPPKITSRYEIFWVKPENRWILNQSKEKILNLLLERVEKWYLMEKLKKEMLYIPREYSIKQYNLIQDIANVATLYSYTHLNDDSDINDTMDRITKEIRKMVR